MILAGIDFSINSTSLCIDHGDHYTWHHFGRDKGGSHIFTDTVISQTLFPQRKKGDDYCNTERMKIDDSNNLCYSIIKILQENKIERVAFEGHSFNSKGNSLLELVAYQFLLRNMIHFSMGLSLDSMYFYSPITVKSFAGGAKFKKKDLLERFMECDDQVLRQSPLYNYLRALGDGCLKRDDVIKPIDDLVDSYWIVKKLKQDV